MNRMRGQGKETGIDAGGGGWLHEEGMLTQFTQASQEFLESVWRHDPVMATRMGVHEHDHRWPNGDPDAMQAWGDELRSLVRRLEEIDPTSLACDEKLDRRWALAVLDYMLVNHELELWRRSPQTVVQGVGTGLHSLLIGGFAPLEARLESRLFPPS
jgi:uncharacterized protein (DUF885 family)